MEKQSRTAKKFFSFTYRMKLAVYDLINRILANVEKNGARDMRQTSKICIYFFLLRAHTSLINYGG